MNNGILSQEEIDALLKAQNLNVETEEDEFLSEMDKDILGEVGNISMGNASTTLSMLVNRKVKIDTPKIEIVSKEKLKNEYPKPFVAVEVQYTKGLEGANLLIIKKEDALRIVDLMMGGNGEVSDGELTELHISAIGEAMNQMMGAAATSMSEMLKTRIDISPLTVEMADLQSGQLDDNAVLQQTHFIKIAFQMEIMGLVKSELMQLVPFSFARKLIKDMTSYSEMEEDNLVQESHDQKVALNNKSDFISSGREGERKGMSKPLEKQVEVQPVQFAPLSPSSGSIEKSNLDLIMDVPLQVTVELGRTQKLIKDILELGHGSILELDKLAGEPVDILINGKLIAKGEVVVIDENFGVRVTDIVSPIERVNSLQ